MNQSTKTYLLWIIGIVVVVGLVWWATNQRASAPAEDEPYKVGAIVFLTGAQASLGEEVHNALLLAQEQYNDEHRRDIQLVIEDSQDDPKLALSSYRKLLSSGIPIMVSTGDQVNFALSPVANSDHTLLMMTVTASGEIAGDYVFRGFITAEQQAEIMGRYATENLDLNHVGVIYINNVFGESYRDQFRETFIAGGGQLTTQETYGIADKDVRTQVLKTIQQSPDAVVVTGFGPAYPLVFRQLREQGWDGPILADSTISIPFFFNEAGVNNLFETHFTDTSFSIDSPRNKVMERFVAAYQEKYSADPGWIGAFAFDSFNVLATAIDECGYDADAVKDCLLQVRDEQGALGPIDFTTHEMDVPLLVKKVENGSVVVQEEF